MARRWPLRHLATLIAGFCLVIATGMLPTLDAKSPPPAKRPPPTSVPARQPPPTVSIVKQSPPPPSATKRPPSPSSTAKRSPPRRVNTPSPNTGVVNITVFVAGQVAVYTSHEHPGHNASRDNAEKRVPPKADVIHTLIDRSDETNGPNPSTIRIPVDFGSRSDTVLSGDLLEVPLQVQVPASLARQLNLGTSGSRRRLLSEQDEHARRMLLGYHNTRRSVTEFQKLSDVLQQYNLSLTTPVIAKDFKIVSSNLAKDLFIVNGQPQNISSLTFMFYSSACGVYPKLTAESLREQWYDSGDNVRAVATTERYYKSCTYDQLRFPQDRNLIFSVDINCVGNMSRGPYNLTGGFGNRFNLDNEIFALLERGREFIRSNHPDVFSKWSSFRRKIMIFPFNYAKFYAPFGGLAAVGCVEGFDCTTWMNPGVGDTRIDLPVLFQELGHNIGLAHSSRILCNLGSCTRDEYGDHADPMGWGTPINWDKGLVCTNAPQAYKAGWASPIPQGEVIYRELARGVHLRYTLPAMALNKNNMLRIIIEPATLPNVDRRKPEHAVFVSYRVRQSGPGTYDSGLENNYNSRVWVHEYNDTDNALPANMRAPPLVLAMLSDEMVPNTRNRSQLVPPSVPSWGQLSRNFTFRVGPSGGLRITLQSRSASNATVALCRFNSTVEDPGMGMCDNGLDDDCDGLADLEDPDCMAPVTMERSPPPQPSPQPRRPPPPSPSRPPPQRSPSPRPPVSPRRPPPKGARQRG